ncbi:hypothetical protein EIN_024070 [Entamoeba invadens IP1]|uniref:hypothetical protein n=1 Tax=Entamoeba invadens IP1 TaxID=370355 RepID=UPI0002C3F0E6|nr:hypothetical protein EIN_024070 [Entamoeba invadens IP1]ELP90698.1 hypothetical protein EIN_024070 [Entamoeba invadens IP1]|eukprot:XP_004257469.1 hypothetical protein EIN_024070 [Entamoeba invadens IP1]
MSKSLTPEEIQRQQRFNRHQSNLFSDACKDYERKDYNGALLKCEKILSSLPENGEALSMKNLAKYFKREQSGADTMKGIKNALKNNLRSPTIWHLYGIVAREQKDYVESLKAFKTMNNIDGKSLALKRDLFCLQIQNRDFLGAVDTIDQMIVLRKDYQNNFICKAVASFMGGQNDKALNALDYFLLHYSDNSDKVRYNDLLMFKIQILMKGKLYNAVLDFIKTNTDNLLEGIKAKEYVATCLTELGKKQEALDMLETLLKINKNNTTYHELVLKNLNITNALEMTPEQFDVFKKFNEKLCIGDTLYGTTETLCYQQYDEVFEQDITKFIVKLLENSRINVFKILSPLFNKNTSRNHAEKRTFVENSFLRIAEALKNCTSYKTLSAKFIQQHHIPIIQARIVFLLKGGKTEEALAYATAIDETEFNLKYYYLAKCHMKLGQFPLALREIKTAFDLNPNDRFFYNKAIKYALIAGDITKAENLSKTKDNSEEDLKTESLIFTLRFAEAYLKSGNKDLARKRALMILQKFDKGVTDMFEFHLYVYEKLSICAYLDLMDNNMKYQDSDIKKKALEIVQQTQEI